MKLMIPEGKRRSIFLPWLYSYVIILIVPVIISFFVYIMYGKIIEEEVTRTNSSSIKQLQEVMDGYLRSIEKVSNEIGLDKNIIGLLNLRDKPNEYHQYRMIEIIQDLKIYKASNSMIDHFYIHSNKNDFALAYTGKLDSKLFYELYHDNSEVTYDNWIKTIQRKHSREYVPIPIKTPTGVVMDSVAFMQSLPMGYSDDSNTGTLVIMLDMSQVLKLLQSTKWTNLGTLLIIDENDVMIKSTGPLDSLPSDLKYESLSNISGTVHSKWKDEDVVISYISSGITKWKYVSIIPSKIFYSKAKYIRNITVISTFLCLIVGSIIAYFFTKKNYNPLKRIVDVIVDKVSISAEDNSNEYNFIKNAVLNIIDEKNEAYQKLDRQNSMLKVNFLLKLLKGDFDIDIPIEEAMTCYDMKFDSDTFAVMLFLIEDYGIFEKDGSNKLEDMRLARLVVGNVIEEIINQKNRAYVLQEDDVIACIVNFQPENSIAYREEMLDTVNQSQKFILDKFSIRYTVSLSSIHQNYYGISKAYREALEAMEYRIVIGNGKIIEYEKIKERSNKSNLHTFNLEIEYRFMNCIKARDFKNARLIMHDVINDCFYKSEMPIQMAKCLMFSIINTMINAINEMSIIYDKNFMERLNPVEQLLKCKTVEEIEQKMDSILNSIERNIEESNRRVSSELWKEVKDYIEDNYSDINLSVSILAEHFHVNATYLTSYYKGKTGEGLLECISRTRINRAKQLLKSNEMSLSDIAENVGYYSSSTLIRVFKKIEGITPGKYRELLGEIEK